MINNPHLNERASKEQSFIFNTFSEVINARRDCIAKGVTFISSGKRSYLSYAQIYAKAVHAAAYLTESGFKKGDWLIFQIERKSDFVPILWACLLTGVIALPVTFSIKKDGSEFLRKIIKLSDNVRLVTTKDYWDFLEQNGSTDGLGVPVLVEEIEEYSGKPFDGNINITPDDLAFIQFSSGSTNSPKGVKISHRNLMCSCRMMHRGVQMNAEDIVSVWLPLTYDMGLIGGHLLFVFSCCDEVLLDVADFMTDPLAWLRTISDYKVTITIAPNSSYHMMCQKYKAEKAIGVDFNFDFSNWRSAVCGGGRLSSKCNTKRLPKDFSRGSPPETSSWSVVNKIDNKVNVILSNSSKIKSFRKEKANNIVSILISTSLPRLVRFSKINLSLQYFLKITEICKL